MRAPNSELASWGERSRPRLDDVTLAKCRTKQHRRCPKITATLATPPFSVWRRRRRQTRHPPNLTRPTPPTMASPATPQLPPSRTISNTLSPSDKPWSVLRRPVARRSSGRSIQRYCDEGILPRKKSAPFSVPNGSSTRRRLRNLSRRSRSSLATLATPPAPT